LIKKRPVPFLICVGNSQLWRGVIYLQDQKGGLDKSSPYIKQTKRIHKKNQNLSVHLYIHKGGLDESSPYTI
jgi:hypothetical protein